MAFHNSTPRSVLEAPEQTVVFIHENKYANRSERRHARTSTGATVNIPKQHQMQPLNEPYVRATASQGAED